MNKVTKILNVKKNELGKFMSRNSQGAGMSFNIKDHKQPNAEGIFPVRPIASVHGTPVDKMDFIIQSVLVQILPLLPYHLENKLKLLHFLDTWNARPSRIVDNTNVFSLDVVNLYPNIPVNIGIGLVMNSVKEHFNSVNSFGISLPLFLQMLRVVSKNYHILFNNQTYLQREGVPMGARYAPPFAIIVMHHIEQAALKTIEDSNLCKILFYGRYIDDIIFITESTNHQASTSLPPRILDLFNDNKFKMQFTLEQCDPIKGLPFLDTCISINKNCNRIDYKWYQKELHSGNCLHNDAFISDKTKSNFLKNSFTNAFQCCNNSPALSQSIDDLVVMFSRNGYPNNKIKKLLNIAIRDFNDKNKTPNKVKFNEDIKNKTLFKSCFIHNGFDKKVEELATKHKLDIKAISDKSRHIADIAKPKDNRHRLICNKTNCLICKKLSDDISCLNTNVVYGFGCYKEECPATYIGKTDATIGQRFYQHRMGVNRNDHRNPLVRHFREHHNSEPNIFGDWNFSVLAKFNRDPVETALGEARLIESKKPTINRKRECRTLFDC